MKKVAWQKKLALIQVSTPDDSLTTIHANVVQENSRKVNQSSIYKFHLLDPSIADEPYVSQQYVVRDFTKYITWLETQFASHGWDERGNQKKKHSLLLDLDNTLYIMCQRMTKIHQMIGP